MRADHSGHAWQKAFVQPHAPMHMDAAAQSMNGMSTLTHAKYTPGVQCTQYILHETSMTGMLEFRKEVLYD